jgi:hypothetical protein
MTTNAPAPTEPGPTLAWYKILPTVLLLFLLAGGGWFAWRLLKILPPGSNTRMIPTTTVVQQVQSLAQLVTVKYVMEKVVILEDVKWYGESRVLLVAHGIVKGGVDLSQIKPDHVRIYGDRIKVFLPRAAITDAYLDDNQTKIVERSTGLLRTFDKDLEQNARQSAVSDIRRAAREAGILRDAEERARLQLQAFFHQLGFRQVEFE